MICKLKEYCHYVVSDKQYEDIDVDDDTANSDDDDADNITDDDAGNYADDDTDDDNDPCDDEDNVNHETYSTKHTGESRDEEEKFNLNGLLTTTEESDLESSYV